MSRFTDRLANATNEDKQVNPIYVEEIDRQFKRVKDENGEQIIGIDTNSVSFGNTDGIYQCWYINSVQDDRGGGVLQKYRKPFLMLLECKLNTDFKDAIERAKVILQACCYLRDMVNSGSDVPQVLVLGSKVNCCSVPTKLLEKYYKFGYIAGYKQASTAWSNPENRFILDNIVKDIKIESEVIIHNTTESDAIENLCEYICKQAQNLEITKEFNEHVISKAFDFFERNVLSPKVSETLTSRMKAQLLMEMILSPEKVQFTGTNALGINLNQETCEVSIDGNIVTCMKAGFNQFKELYRFRKYANKEIKEITAITDRLIEDSDRRRKGDFYTPTIWVDEAHELLTKNLGENWKDEYMVWDCAWGTGNLTRDYRFEDLYCSTLQEEDLIVGERYNRNACKFQYDFLNDDVYEFEQFREAVRYKQYDLAETILVNTKLYKSAPGIIDGLMGNNGKPRKKLLFLINPPYGTSGELKAMHNDDVGHKEGIGYSAINELMTDEKVGTCSRQLVAQFMYRINLLQKIFRADIKLGMFSPTSVLTSNDYEGLLMKIDYHLGFTEGFMFCASDFADVKPNWSIMFSLYSTDNSAHDRRNVLKVMSIDGKFESFDKILYMIDKDNKASWWTKKPIEKCNKTRDICYLKSALNTNTSKEHNMAIENSLGGFLCNANIVDNNTQYVSLLSAMSGQAISLNLGKENFDRVISLFAARRLISGKYATWINCKDEYMVPNTEHPLYSQWEKDCVAYSLFNTASNQSSLRNIEYNGKTWDIKNEFFWMSQWDMDDLANGTYNSDDVNTDVSNDIAKFGGERFIYEKLKTVELSPDAKAVLDKATELVKSSFKYREQFNIMHPEYHINTWDAGWYQIKGLLKEYDKQGLEEFNKLYKAFEDRLRPLVYELGFLYK